MGEIVDNNKLLGIAAIITALLGTGGIATYLLNTENQQNSKPSSSSEQTIPNSSDNLVSNKVTFFIQPIPIRTGELGYNADIFINDEYKGKITNEPNNSDPLKVRVISGEHEYRVEVDVFAFDEFTNEPIPITKDSATGRINIEDGDVFNLVQYGDEPPKLVKK